MGRLDGKVALISGGAKGQGATEARLFAREGARVLCVDLARERAEETVGVIRGEGGQAAAFAADVTRAADCHAMVAEALRLFHGLDVLHNNVGIESRKDLVDTTEEDWDQVMTVDLKSMFLATRATVPEMTKRGTGSIICVSSVAGLRAYRRTAYAAAKAGVIGFVRSVAGQIGPQGVRINAIAPGLVWTPMVENLGPEMREQRRAASLLGTEGTGWDVGWSAVFLASDESRWITGQTLVVDAGLTLTTR
jgi:NAD(P)-dependent dehydrogenase (short-subunit alcohol dehydrogenase family)